MFDVPMSPEPSVCKCLQQCESTENEDWDLELSFGEKPPEAIAHRDDIDGKTKNEDDEPLVIVDAYAPAPVSSLLDYLNNYVVETLVSSKPRRVLCPLPRQPTLFSSYVNYQRQQGSSFGEIANQHKPLQQPFACTRLSGNSSSFLVPQAPESAIDVVAWLQNICDKICHVSVVVARPSPERVGVYIERERPPSKEIGLERALRAAELAYCNGSWHASSAHSKALLHHLENQATKRGTARKIVSLGGRLRRLMTMDEDVRCYQCCGRLARLLCRLAQRCGECIAVGRLKATPCRSIQLDRCEPAWPTLPDARDVAAFRRGTADLVDNIDDCVLRAKSKLIINESMTHLALVHTRLKQQFVCEQMRPENSTIANEISICCGGCWCGALPPLPRSGIAEALDVAHSLRKDLRSQAANEIEAFVLADLRLEAMGHSPLTTERLAHREPLERSSSSVIWRDMSKSLWNSHEAMLSRVTFEEGVACEASVALESALEGEWSLNASGRIEGRLINLVSTLPPSSLARAKAALALGLSHLRGVERLRGHRVMSELFLKQVRAIPPKFGHGRKALHATRELRIAEMLLFEATCVLEQHTTTLPVDLPFHAHRQHVLDVVSSCCRGDATVYSVLACSMGYTALRGLARAFERRAKHAYAVLVLDVCVAVLRLRDDANEMRKLQRELCVVSTRQGNNTTGTAHCKRILRHGSLRDCASHSFLETRKSIIDNFTQIKYIAIDSAVVFNVHELFFTSHLLLAQHMRSGEAEDAYEMMDQFQKDSHQRQNICTTVAAIHEIRQSMRLGNLYAACIVLAHSEPGCAVSYLDYSLALCPTSRRRRVAVLSYLVEAKVLCGDAAGARNSLRRINRLRQHDVRESLGQKLWNVQNNDASDLCSPLWAAPVKGRLVLFCDEDFDLGLFAAEISLLESAPRRALKIVTPTVAAVEAAVSRFGSALGLRELGSLYELRGRAQVALARYTGPTDFPLDFNDVEDDTNTSDSYCSHQIGADDMSQWSRSRHYKCFVSSNDVRADALRWYRHALECYRATDDLYSAARSASTFAALNIDTMFLEHALTSSLSRQVLPNTNARLEDVRSAARHALNIAAIVDEPLLLLEAYLNVAELLYVSKDSLGAIAHWWEARELLLQLFVDTNIIPMTIVADLYTILQLRTILERLLRFLAAVADRAMIDENLALFDTFILFERDTVHRRSRIPTGSCSLRSQNVRSHRSDSRCILSKSSVCKGLVRDDVLSCWHSIVGIRADVTRHCLGELPLSELHSRNRNALCLLIGMMRRIRIRNFINKTLDTPTSFAVHVAGILIVYAPQLGWRHALAFGHSARGLDSAGAALIRTLAGAHCVVTKSHEIERRRAVLNQVSHVVALPCNFFSTALAVEGKERQVATLSCSEKAQVLPWEFMSDVAISRILGIAAAANRFISLSNRRQRVHAKIRRPSDKVWQWNDSYTPQTDALCLLIEEHGLDDAQRFVGLIVRDLSSLASNSTSRIQLVHRPRSEPRSCLAWCPRVVSNDDKSQSSHQYNFGVLPLSTLYAAPEYLIPLQTGQIELFGIPDAAITQITARLLAQSNFADGALLAKSVTDDLALPIVHCHLACPRRYLD